MKDCRDCEFFNGYDYSDGTPQCENDGGYEACPFNDYTSIKNNGMKIEIDAGFMQDYIRHTLQNTIESSAISIATIEIQKLITDEIKKKVLAEIDAQVKTTVSNAISEFMNAEITIGGGWCEPERKLTRSAYLAETIQNELGKKFKSDVLKEYAVKEAKSAIDTYEKKLRDEVNVGVKTYFDAATRQVLTENVVSMLMSNDTYQKLSNSMQTFLK